MAQLGTIKLQTDSGIVDVPVFEISDFPNNGSTIDALRVQTDSGIGAIPLTDPTDAASPQEAIRVQTDSGVKAVTDSVSAIPDSGDLFLEIDAIKQSPSGTISTLTDQQGNYDMGGGSANAGTLNGHPTIDYPSSSGQIHSNSSAIPVDSDESFTFVFVAKGYDDTNVAFEFGDIQNRDSGFDIDHSGGTGKFDLAFVSGSGSKTDSSIADSSNLSIFIGAYDGSNDTVVIDFYNSSRTDASNTFNQTLTPPAESGNMGGSKNSLSYSAMELQLFAHYTTFKNSSERDELAKYANKRYDVGASI